MERNQNRESTDKFLESRKVKVSRKVGEEKVGEELTGIIPNSTKSRAWTFFKLASRSAWSLSMGAALACAARRPSDEVAGIPNPKYWNAV